MKKIKSDETTLKNFLSIGSDIGTLKIPFSQRPYEWENSQVERLFNDLVGLYHLNDDIHMLNFFTLSTEDGETKIFDGQQRTITTLLIIASFIEKLDKLKLNDAATQLYETYISKKDYLAISASTQFKLKFEDPDVEEFFYELLERNTEKEFNAKNHENLTIKTLISNYQLIKQLLDNFIQRNSLDGQEIIDSINKILNNTNLITITTSTDDLARAMFESLNNTGKQLENYYVLKNDLVIALSEDKVKEKWTSIDSNLSNYDPSAFLLSVSTILTGKSTKQNSLERIYNTFNKNSINEMEFLLDFLLNASKNYLYIRNPAQLVNNDKKVVAEYRELITDLSLFITSQHHPLILAMLIKDVPLKEINTVLKHLLNLGIRNFYFKENRANTIENPIAKLTNDFYKKDLNIGQVIKKIDEISIKDDELRDAITARNVNKNAEKRLKFILRETYNKIDLDKELEIKKSLSEIHLEHILPKSPAKKSQWLIDFKDDEERGFYTQKIGNATLLLEKLNKNISNKDFNLKKEKYNSSHIPENHNIAKSDKWTRSEIDRRTKLLGNKIIKYTNLLISK